MKKLSDFKDDAAIDIWGKLFQIVAEMSEDEKTVEAMKSGNRVKIIACLTSEHPEIAMKILKLFSEEGENYHCTAVSLIKDVKSLLDDKDLMAVFHSQG